MSTASFDEVLLLLKENLDVVDTNMRECIPAEKKLTSHSCSGLWEKLHLETEDSCTGLWEKLHLETEESCTGCTGLWVKLPLETEDSCTGLWEKKPLKTEDSCTGLREKLPLETEDCCTELKEKLRLGTEDSCTGLREKLPLETEVEYFFDRWHFVMCCYHDRLVDTLGSVAVTGRVHYAGLIDGSDVL
ncbi:hypothetical protein PR048_024139 [Dryococelus australis]|uniref:Uncharacterized protein n=1 Tax=Dryococelus australis TaxID=614101 RepID=A0ABQ9GW22_9NEOP|nr:hypothetical protein PR048_024139 [Dryococelus australis]